MINNTYKITRILLTCLLIAGFFGISTFTQCSNIAYASEISRGQFYRTFFNAFGITVNSNYDDNQLALEVDALLSQDAINGVDSITSPIDWKQLSEQSYYSELTNLVMLLYKSLQVDEHNGLEGMYYFKSTIGSYNLTNNYFTFGQSERVFGVSMGNLNLLLDSTYSFSRTDKYSASTYSVSGNLTSFSAWDVKPLLTYKHRLDVIKPDYYGYSSNIFTTSLNGEITCLSGGLLITLDQDEVVELIRPHDVISYLSQYSYVPAAFGNGGLLSQNLNQTNWAFRNGGTVESVNQIVYDYMYAHEFEPLDLTDLFQQISPYISYVSLIPSERLPYVTMKLGIRESFSLPVHYVDMVKAYTMNETSIVHEIATYNGVDWSIKEYIPSTIPSWILSFNYEMSPYFDYLSSGDVVVIAKDLQMGATVDDDLLSYGTSHFVDNLGGSVLNYNKVSLAIKTGPTLKGSDTVIAGGGDGGTVDDSNKDGTIGSGDHIRPEWARHFPLSLPWDISDLGSMFMAAPRAPVIDFPIKNPNGNINYFHLDFTSWGIISTLLRTLFVVLFTYSMIKLFMSLVGLTTGGD